MANNNATMALTFEIQPRGWRHFGLIGTAVVWAALRCGLPVRWFFRAVLI